MRTLLLAAGVVALMVGIACGGAEEPAPAAQQQQAPAAQQQQQAAPAATDAPAAMQPTNTPIPQAVAATVRPTNTPAPTAVPQVAATPTPSAGPKYGGTMIMSAYADTKDWDPLGSGSLSSVISIPSCTTRLCSSTRWTLPLSPATWPSHGTSALMA